MASQTWKKDLYNLFEFESNDVIKSKDGMNATEIDIYLDETEISMEERALGETANKNSICTIKKDEDGYYIPVKEMLKSGNTSD